MKIDPCRHKDHPTEVPKPKDHLTDNIIDWLLDPNPGLEWWKMVGTTALRVVLVGLVIWGLSNWLIWMLG